MVSPVMARPPQRSVLHRCATKPGHDELEDATGLERVMRKVAVVAGRHAQGLEQVAGSGETDDAPRAPHEGREQAYGVHSEDDARRSSVDQSRTKCERERSGWTHTDLRRLSGSVAGGTWRGNALNVEGVTVELHQAKLPERRIGAADRRSQIDESEAALYAGDTIDDELDIAHVHPYKRKGCAQLHFGRSTR